MFESRLCLGVKGYKYKCTKRGWFLLVCHLLAWIVYRMVAYLEPQQLALSLGGCNTLFFRALLDHRRDFVISKLDYNLFIYEARESSLVPAGFLTAQFL